ncbi:phage holin family protein [Actinoplanes sp. ATCC 53533]|uniref:phage holin family protein n=1 Tax=Actinoplanes sp. ATCC 53533 TaxID=1288362 RepID=UPI001F1DD5E2|nr:phage holin family protein [Actinoplanes sp. ATCC 53533]
MRPHRTDGISLSFGLIFLFVAVWWAIAQVVTVRLPAAGWLVAGGLILFGAIGLIGAIRSGRRTEVTAPVQAEAQVETPGDLPPEMHADIVRELLDNPADRVDLHPAYLKHPVSEPPAAPRPASAPPAPASAAPASPTSGPPAPAPPVSGPPAAEPPVSGPPASAPPVAETVVEDEPTAAMPRIAEVAGDEPTAEVTRVDHGQGQDLDGDQDGAPGRR